MSQLASVVVFADRRAEKIRSWLEAVEKNVEAERTAVFLYADGAKSEKDRADVEKTREFIGQYAAGHKFESFTVN